MKTITTLLLVFGAAAVIAQTTLSGKVTLQNSGKKSAFPAQVKAWGATATTVGTDDGSFTLVFDRKQPGDDAALDVVKDGYEVVNREALQVRLPDPTVLQRPLRIYLCPQGQWQRYADHFYQINLTEINRSYQMKLLDLREKYQSAKLQNDEYNAARDQLDKARLAAEGQAQSLAEKFAKANLDDESERFRLAYRLFSEGKTDSVLIVLKEEELLRDLAAAEKEISEGIWLDSIGKLKETNGREAIAASARSLMLKGQLQALHGAWNEAQRNFDLAIAQDSTHPELQEKYVRFLTERREKDSVYTAPEFAGALLDLAEKALAAYSRDKPADLKIRVGQWLEKAKAGLPETAATETLYARLAAIKLRLMK